MNASNPFADPTPQPPTGALYTMFPIPPPPRKSSRRNTTTTIPRIAKPPPLDLNIRNSTLHKRRSQTPLPLVLDLNKPFPSIPEARELEASGARGEMKQAHPHMLTLEACGESSVRVCRLRLRKLESMMSGSGDGNGDGVVGGLEGRDRFTVFMHGD